MSIIAFASRSSEGFAKDVLEVYDIVADAVVGTWELLQSNLMVFGRLLLLA